MKKRVSYRQSPGVASDVEFYSQVRDVFVHARQFVHKTANSAMVKAYWLVGKMIVEKQGGVAKAAYGDGLIASLSIRLTADLGKGFTQANLRYMRLFYLAVNMDDSTDQISRKVLDRAMTIEMNEVDYATLQEGKYEKLSLGDLLLDKPDIQNFTGRRPFDPAILDDTFRAGLDAIKKVLEYTPFAVGYRFAIETVLYREALKVLPLKPETEDEAVPYDKIALDHMILMKVLPRITGTVEDRKELTDKLTAFFDTELAGRTLSKSALGRMEAAAKANGGYLGFWP